MPINNSDGGSILNLVASIIIVLGLPLGFYFVITILNPIDQLNRASSDIGEGFIRGIQRGINETALNDLIKKLTNTIIDGLNANVLEEQSPPPIVIPL